MKSFNFIIYIIYLFNFFHEFLGCDDNNVKYKNGDKWVIFKKKTL